MHSHEGSALSARLTGCTTSGTEFAIDDATSTANARQARLFWSSGQNTGTDSNTRWGTVVLAGHDGGAMPVDRSADPPRPRSRPRRLTGRARAVYSQAAYI
jgi:hypothetical protein